MDKIEIKENVHRPAWTSHSLTGTTPRTIKLRGTTLGLDDTLGLIEHEEGQDEHDEKSAQTEHIRLSVEKQGREEQNHPAVAVAVVHTGPA